MEGDSSDHPQLIGKLSAIEKMRKIAGTSAELRASLAKDLNKSIGTFNYNSNLIATTTSTITTSTLTFSNGSCQPNYSTANTAAGSICSLSSTADCTFQMPMVSLRKKQKRTDKVSKAIQKNTHTVTYKNHPNKGRQNNTPATTSSVTLQNNRFAALSEEAEYVMELDEEDQHEQAEASKQSVAGNEQQKSIMTKPPAICVPQVNKMGKLEEALNSVITADDYDIRTSRFGVSRIYTKDSKVFRAVVNMLTKQNCEFWHHQLREDTPFRLVIRDIHPNVPKQLIERTFTEKGHTVKNIYCPRKPDWRNIEINEDDDEEINNIKTRQNMFYVNLKKTPNVVEALKITQIGRHRVTVMKAKPSKELVQCFRCQDFGHTRNYCLKKPVCGKCSGDHYTGSKSCELSHSDKSICANCGDDHLSSSKSCSVRTELSKKLKPAARLPENGLPTTSKNKNNPVKAQVISNATVRSGFSYADMTRSRGEKYINVNTMQDSSRLVDGVEDQLLSSKFKILEKAINDLNSRMDQMFKLIQDTMEANKAFRDLVQKFISK